MNQPSEPESKIHAQLDVFFRAKNYRPQWLGYGAGALLGGWYLVLMLLWAWNWTTADGASIVRHLLWLTLPIVWAVTLIIGSQFLFGVAELVSRVLRLPKCFPKLLALLFNVALIAWLAWTQLQSQDCWFQRWLGWIGLGGIVLVASLEMITRWIASKETILDIKQRV